MLPDIPGSGEKSAYMQNDCIYSPAEWVAKERAVATALERFQPKTVLDIGCNAGHFSRLAAQSGAAVVAIDRDPGVVGAVWNLARREGLAILPLVIDVARPPGACGWANSECSSFLDRARGNFDCVLMLALMHHLVVNERVPLNRIFELAAQLTRRWLLIEYVDPSDPQFRRIARGRDMLHRDSHTRRFRSRRLRALRDPQSRCRGRDARALHARAKRQLECSAGL
jgi:SAM-dependent methyltransferase